MLDQRVWSLTPHFVSYTVAKAGLWALTQSMALALAPRIRVNGIGPGPALPSPRQTPEQFARQSRLRAAAPRHQPGGDRPRRAGHPCPAGDDRPDAGARRRPAPAMAARPPRPAARGVRLPHGNPADRQQRPARSATCSSATSSSPASIGVHPHEHAAPQRVRINVDLGVEDDGARALSRQPVGARRPGAGSWTTRSWPMRCAASSPPAMSGWLRPWPSASRRPAWPTGAFIRARVRVEKLDIFPDAASAGRGNRAAAAELVHVAEVRHDHGSMARDVNCVAVIIQTRRFSNEHCKINRFSGCLNFWQSAGKPGFPRTFDASASEPAHRVIHSSVDDALPRAAALAECQRAEPPPSQIIPRHAELQQRLPPPPGVAAIEAALATMPLSPGVYRMLDAKGDALYVGKARSLKKRVTAYTQTRPAGRTAAADGERDRRDGGRSPPTPRPRRCCSKPT